jgi:hypothetical protein
MIVAFAGTFASRLDVTGTGHSGGHAETRQYPTHQHNIYCEKRNESQPARHKLHLLLCDLSRANTMRGLIDTLSKHIAAASDGY